MGTGVGGCDGFSVVLCSRLEALGGGVGATDPSVGVGELGMRLVETRDFFWGVLTAGGIEAVFLLGFLRGMETSNGDETFALVFPVAVTCSVVTDGRGGNC